MDQRQNRKYKGINIPLDYTKDFRELSKSDIDSYFKWFLNVKNERVRNLCQFLFLDQISCLRETNLKSIEIFLLDSILSVKSNDLHIKSHIKKFYNQVIPKSFSGQVSFGEETISICYDIGIFMGELIIELDPAIYWKLETDTSILDYGQPLLVKKDNNFDVNPFIVVKNAAAKIYRNEYQDGQIISFFNTWKRLFNIPIN